MVNPATAGKNVGVYDVVAAEAQARKNITVISSASAPRLKPLAVDALMLEATAGADGRLLAYTNGANARPIASTASDPCPPSRAIAAAASDGPSA